MKEVFKRDSSMKYKVGSQIFVKEVAKPEQPHVMVPLEFQSVDTEAFREIANKVHAHFSKNWSEEDNQILVIVSLEALQLTRKRIVRNSACMDDLPKPERHPQGLHSH
jgi:hypothetical protein